MILFYYPGEPFTKIALVVAITFLCLITIMIIQTLRNRKIISKTKLPICHDMIEEYKLCSRCKGFYVGLAFFGTLIAIRNYIYVELLKTIGFYPYTVLMFLVMLSVPIHGALRRLKITQTTRLLNATGFLFGSSLYLIASWTIHIVYG